jgi:hypothetical protein
MTVSKASRNAGEVTQDFDRLKFRRIPFRWVIFEGPKVRRKSAVRRYRLH